MATKTVEKRKLKNGSVTYRGRVRITKFGKVIDKAEQTFSNRETAKKWVDKVAKKLEEKQIEIANGTYHEKKDSDLKEITVAQLIKEYLDDPQISEDLGRTKKYVLESLYNYDIAHIIVSQLTPQDLIHHCKERLKGQYINNRLVIPSPQTVYHDVTYLFSVVKHAKVGFGVNSNLHYHTEAIPTLVKMKLIGRSGKRDRRLEGNELELLEEALHSRESHRSAKIPYCDILKFSIYTAMRVGEITKLKWSDVDHEHKTIKVRDRKDPRKRDTNKNSNDGLVPLLEEAYPVLMRQKERVDPSKPNLIFPYNPKSITAGWQRVRSKLGIENLRYHDLRREGATRLAEKGYDIRTVAQVTGHKNLNILHDIYTEIEFKKFSKSEFEKYQNNKEEA